MDLLIEEKKSLAIFSRAFSFDQARVLSVQTVNWFSPAAASLKRLFTSILAIAHFFTTFGKF